MLLCGVVALAVRLAVLLLVVVVIVRVRLPRLVEALRLRGGGETGEGVRACAKTGCQRARGAARPRPRTSSTPPSSLKRRKIQNHIVAPIMVAMFLWKGATCGAWKPAQGAGRGGVGDGGGEERKNIARRCAGMWGVGDGGATHRRTWRHRWQRHARHALPCEGRARL